MRLLRMLAGLACIGAALVLVAFALVDGGIQGPSSPALMAHLPPVAFGLALLALGAWLLLGGRGR